jgi:hypothetical protein
MASLLYLKHAFNESDEDVCQRWGETPTWQYFSGNDYFVVSEKFTFSASPISSNRS